MTRGKTLNAVCNDLNSHRKTQKLKASDKEHPAVSRLKLSLRKSIIFVLIVYRKKQKITLRYSKDNKIELG